MSVPTPGIKWVSPTTCAKTKKQLFKEDEYFSYERNCDND